MKYFISSLIIGPMIFNLSFAGGMADKTIGVIHRDDPAINRLIPENAVIEVLAEGLDWSEGPV